MNPVKPNTIKYGVALIWLSAIITLLVTLAIMLNFLPFTMKTVDAVPGFLTAGFLGFCAYKINKGSNWARWLLLLVCLLGGILTPFIFFFAPHAFKGMPSILIANGFVQCTLQTAALVLFFIKPSSNWYKDNVVSIENNL